MKYHFELLPVHPRPEIGESLSSFITRVAELNQIESYTELSMRLFSKHKGLKYNGDYDLSPRKFIDCKRVVNIKTKNLRALTFYYLTENLGRPNSSLGISSFLKESVCTTLRVCPLCLQEKGYYQLIWRIMDIKYCHIHKCKLIGTCDQCGKELSLFSMPFKILHCSNCDMDLRLLKPSFTTHIPNQQLALHDFTKHFIARKKYKSYQYEEIRSDLGVLIHAKRMAISVTQMQLDKIMGKPDSTTYYIERGNNRGYSYLDYFHYFDFLNIDVNALLHILSLNKNKQFFRRNYKYVKKHQLDTTLLFEIIRILELFSSQKISISSELLVKITGAEEKELVTAKEIRDALQKYGVDVEKIILKIISKTVKEMTVDGEYPSSKEIIQAIGIEYGIISTFPEVSDLLDTIDRIKNEENRESQKNIDDVLSNLPRVESCLLMNELPINQAQTFSMLGVTKYYVTQKYPELHEQIIDMLERVRIQNKLNINLSEESKLEYEKNLLNEIQFIREKLSSQGITESLRLIAREVGISVQTLRKYQTIREELRDIALTHKKWRISLEKLGLAHLDFDDLDDRLIIEDRLFELINELRRAAIVNGGHITQKIVSYQLNIPVTTLRRFPKIRAIFDEIALLNHPWKNNYDAMYSKIAWPKKSFNYCMQKEYLRARLIFIYESLTRQGRHKSITQLEYDLSGCTDEVLPSFEFHLEYCDRFLQQKELRVLM